MEGEEGEGGAEAPRPALQSPPRQDRDCSHIVSHGLLAVHGTACINCVHATGAQAWDKLKPQTPSDAGAHAGASQGPQPTPSPEPPAPQPPSQPAAYTPPEAWSAEWMEQHPDPEFRQDLQDLLGAGYCWPEEVRTLLRHPESTYPWGVEGPVWPEGAGPNPVPLRFPSQPSAPARASASSSEQVGEKRQRSMLSKHIMASITLGGKNSV